MPIPNWLPAIANRLAPTVTAPPQGGTPQPIGTTLPAYYAGAIPAEIAKLSPAEIDKYLKEHFTMPPTYWEPIKTGTAADAYKQDIQNYMASVKAQDEASWQSFVQKYVNPSYAASAKWSAQHPNAVPRSYNPATATPTVPATSGPQALAQRQPRTAQAPSPILGGFPSYYAAPTWTNPLQPNRRSNPFGGFTPYYS